MGILNKMGRGGGCPLRGDGAAGGEPGVEEYAAGRGGRDELRVENQLGRWRNGEPGLGVDVDAHVYPLGGEQPLQVCREQLAEIGRAHV